ncbi:MAG TPA: NYN domain-containing protein [Candidatus Hydrogenedentes bacterium]|nr:NYN domain-containing protein [Candidatus Hydrogenedentota bacterium]
MKRVIAYIDGFNLYFGLREKGWKHLYWLNLYHLCERLLLQDQQIVTVKYFTARVSFPEDKRLRQNAFLEALETQKGIEIFFGKYMLHSRVCSQCGWVDKVPSEKMTDVNIAVEMVSDALQDVFDTAILISADSDLVGAIMKIRQFCPNKRVVLAFPPARVSKELQQAAHASFTLGHGVLKNSQFPNEIEKPGGFILRRPVNWQ